MEKYIEEIIEIVLDNVSCDHQPCDEYSAGGSGAGHVDYSLDNEQKVIKKALQVLEKIGEGRKKSSIFIMSILEFQKNSCEKSLINVAPEMRSAYMANINQGQFPSSIYLEA